MKFAKLGDIAPSDAEQLMKLVDGLEERAKAIGRVSRDDTYEVLTKVHEHPAAESGFVMRDGVEFVWSYVELTQSGLYVGNVRVPDEIDQISVVWANSRAGILRLLAANTAGLMEDVEVEEVEEGFDARDSESLREWLPMAWWETLEWAFDQPESGGALVALRECATLVESSRAAMVVQSFLDNFEWTTEDEGAERLRCLAKLTSWACPVAQHLAIRASVDHTIKELLAATLAECEGEIRKRLMLGMPGTLAAWDRPFDTEALARCEAGSCRCRHHFQ